MSMMGLNEKGDNTNDTKRIFTEVAANNFPNMGKESEIQIREAYIHNQNKSTP